MILIQKLILIILIFGSFHTTAAQSIVQGVLDLRHEHREKFVIDLNGEWRFYWNRPESIDSLTEIPSDGYFSIPGYWAGLTLHGEKQPDTGYATFALTIYVPPKYIGIPLALQTPDQNAAYTVWVDNKMISSSGRAGTTNKTTKSQAIMHIASFTPTSEKVDVVMRVSNFIGGGGPHNALSIGTYGALLNRFAVNHGLDLLFLGALLLTGFFHLGLYSLQREMHSYLSFAIFALCWALRFFVEGMHSRPITFLFPNLSFEYLSRFEVIAATPTSWLLLLFVYTLFPEEKKQGWLRFACIVSAGLFLSSLVAPVVYMSGILSTFEIFSFIMIYPIHTALIRAIKKRQNGARLVFLGIILFTFAGINDILYSLRIIDTMYIISIGIVLQTLFFSIVLSRRFAHAYSSAKSLSLELKEKNRSLNQLNILKDEFIANTSHELRTPLQGIVGLAEGLSQSVVSPSSSQTQLVTGLSLIAASGRRLSYLINDIQDFSRIKNGDLALSKKGVDIYCSVSTVIALSNHLRRSDNIAFKNELSQKFPLVYADEDRLEQILYNLIGNAIKYTPSGSITINGCIEGKNAVISIKDTGIGITEDKLETIFLPYEQVATVEEQQAGTGIGLSITKKLVELHGGSISASSHYGNGSCFTFTLPFAPEGTVCTENKFLLSSVLPDITFSGIPEKSIPSVERVSATILVVDDDPVNRAVFTMVLSQHYTSVIEANDGYDALDKIKEHAIDLVLLDIMMPRLNGYETLKIIRESYSPIELPVLILTAKNRSIDLVTGFNAGANDYLTKPCGSEELLARVSSQIQIGKLEALREENQALAHIIKTEREMQQESFAALRRMETMLDTLSDPVVLIDAMHSISYVNRSFCTLTGKDSGTIIGTAIETIISESAFIERIDAIFSGVVDNDMPVMVHSSIAAISYTLSLTTITAGDEVLLMITPADSATLMIKANTEIPEIKKGNDVLEKNECAKRAIKEALRCWSEKTGLSALELARQSGLWKIHMNPDGWERAKTLDRYLSTIDFPKNPRIKTIVATIAFVIEMLDSQSPNRTSLLDHFNDLEKWM